MKCHFCQRVIKPIDLIPVALIVRGERVPQIVLLVGAMPGYTVHSNGYLGRKRYGDIPVVCVTVKTS